MIAIIPARGGSKRIPGKNIKDFLGKPIIAYAIETAIQSGLFETVMVSTDDEQIAAIAVRYGATVPFLRSEKNSDDFSSTTDVLLEVLDKYAKLGNPLAPVCCCIYPTSPLVQVEDLQQAAQQFETIQADTMVSAVPYSFPVQRSFRLNPSQLIQPVEPESMSKRSQDLEITYHDAGAFYFFRTEQFQHLKTVWTANTAAYILDELKVQDIDTETDWKLAELKYDLLRK